MYVASLQNIHPLKSFFATYATERLFTLVYMDTFQFYRFGLAGGENVYNPICVLPLNMINQKYFSFLYVWMGLLVVLTLGIITFRVLMVILPDFRTIVLKSFYGIKVKKVTVSYFPHFKEIDKVF